MFEGLVPHLPALQVVVPLLAAPLAAITRRGSLAWFIALVSSWAAFAISILLLDRVLDESVISYALGGWAPPLGIEYRIDAANAFVLLIVSGISAIALPYARRSIESEIEPRLHSLFYTCFLLCLTGLLGVTITGDAFNVFVFLEISSLSTYALVAMGAARDRRALTAAYNYLIMGTIGATFFVIGIGLLYMMTGTLNMADLAERIANLEEQRTIRAGFAFIIVGIGLKLAMFPLHLWLPNAYTFAPSAVTVFLAATSTKVAVYVVLRFVFTVFSPSFEFVSYTLELVLLPLALVAMFASSIVAIFQSSLKRMLAYSSVAQIGYMLLGVSLTTSTGLTAAILHLFNHALMKATLFMAVGAIILRIGVDKIEDLGGLGRQMPWTMGAFVIAGLSLIGVPLTVGFISKWYLILAALEQGQWWIAFLVVASSLLAVIYVWRVVEAAYLQPPHPRPPVDRAPLSMVIPLWLFVAANIYFGVDAEFTATVARFAANTLLFDP